MADFKAVEAKLDALQAALDLEQLQIHSALAAIRGVGTVAVPSPRLAFGDRLTIRAPRLAGQGRIS
jgi:hypothetical protein